MKNYIFCASILLISIFAFSLNTQAGSLLLAGKVEANRSAPVPKDTALRNAKYLDSQLPIGERVDDLMAQLTPEEKASLLFGCNNIGAGDIARVGLPAVNFTDGPQGVRLPNQKATAFPAEIGMAASWDVKLMQKVGQVIGQECLAARRRVWFGPGLNMMRSPLGARNFEYMGEDPYLAGYMAAAIINGVQSQGVAACPKHWILNDQEVHRNTIDVICGQRALHEIYAKPFEIAIKHSHPWAIMLANNRANGDWCTENRELVRGLLYRELGFGGATISDWLAVHHHDQAINAGCDIQMPFSHNPGRDAEIVKRIAEGRVSESAVNFDVRHILRLFFRVCAFQRPRRGSINTPEHQEVARQMATESIVLLKNKGNILPLNASRLRKIAVIGPNAAAYHTMAGGAPLAVEGGSGASNPPFEITPLAALRQRFGGKIIYQPGFTFNQRKPINTNFTAAVAAARRADVVLLFAGLNFTVEGEGQGWDSSKRADRKNLKLIGPQAALIEAVVKANPNTIVILNNGAPVDLEPWNNSVAGLVEAWYGGMEAGNAICDVLFGKADPSGRLPCTFAAKLTDWRTHQLGKECWPGTGANGKIVYKEGIWMGYRWFDHSRIKPLYPFGFGLSYTTFSFTHFEATSHPDGSVTATVDVTNTGNRPGAEVVEIYMVPPPNQPVERPVQELRRFARLNLAPHQTKTAIFTLNRNDFAYYDSHIEKWRVLPGRYELRASASSRDVRARTFINVK